MKANAINIRWERNGSGGIGCCSAAKRRLAVMMAIARARRRL